MKSLFCLLLISIIANAQTPAHWLSLQGLLLKPSGQRLVDGNYPACFRIFPLPSGGTAVWEECDTIAVVDGYYQTHLGDQNKLPLANGNGAFVELEVDGEVMPGRVALTGSAGAWTSVAVIDTIWDGVKMGTDVAVRSLNGLRNDVILKGSGTLGLYTNGDTIHLEGYDSFDSTQRQRLASVEAHAERPHIMFTNDSAKIRAERLADSSQAGLLSAQDYQRFAAKGDMHSDSISILKLMVHQRGDGWVAPKCNNTTEGTIRFEANFWVDGSGTLMVCLYNGISGLYAWDVVGPMH